MSAFLCIATLINSNLPRDHIILFLGGAETNVLRQYLWNAKVYTGLSSKNKKKFDWDDNLWVYVWQNKWYIIDWRDWQKNIKKF